MLEAVAASLVAGTEFRHFDDTDPFTSLASVIQMETAVFEGRFLEIADAGFVPTRSNLGRHQAAVGFVPAAAGFAQIGRLDAAITIANDVLGNVAVHHRSDPIAAVAARAIVAECEIRLGTTTPEQALSTLPDEDVPGGFTGALILRAQTAAARPGALDELRSVAVVLRAPGLLLGVDDGASLATAAPSS
jgi:hypothetical protein